MAQGPMGRLKSILITASSLKGSFAGQLAQMEMSRMLEETEGI